MNPEVKRQVWQSLGQFFIVFFSGMGVYKGWTEVVQMGIANAIYQPLIQGVLAAGLILGISKLGTKP